MVIVDLLVKWTMGLYDYRKPKPVRRLWFENLPQQRRRQGGGGVDRVERPSPLWSRGSAKLEGKNHNK